MSIVQQQTLSTGRERMLMIIAGIIFLMLFLYALNYFFGSEVAGKLKTRNRLQEQVDELTVKTRNESVTRRLNSYMSKSLPPVDLLAPSLYQNWLIEQAGRSGISNPKIDAGTSKMHKEVYKSYTFTFRGRGSLEQFTNFLREFQDYDHLHLIRGATIKPLKESRELDITIVIETLALIGAPQSKTLTMNLRQPAPDRALEDEKVKRIVDRAFFSAYVPPPPPGQPPPPPQEKPKFNPAPYCFVTAVVESKGRSQAWIDHRTEGKKERLREGAKFRVGTIDCRLTKIEFTAIEFSMLDAKTGSTLYFKVRVGDSFDDAEFLREEEPIKTKAG